jgi:hypothetical protein
MAIQELQNPAEKDPKPPYKKQSQPWPGLASAIEGLGGLDIIVSNAGRQQTRASILDVSSEDFNVTMKTNIYGPVLDHRSGASSSQTRFGRHTNRFRAGVRPIPGFV